MHPSDQSAERPSLNVQIHNTAGAEVSVRETAAGLMVMVDRKIEAGLRAFDRALPARLSERALRA